MKNLARLHLEHCMWSERTEVSIVPPCLRACFYIHRNNYSHIHWQGIYQPFHVFFNLLQNIKTKFNLLIQNISKQPITAPQVKWKFFLSFSLLLRIKILFWEYLSQTSRRTSGRRLLLLILSLDTWGKVQALKISQSEQFLLIVKIRLVFPNKIWACTGIQYFFLSPHASYSEIKQKLKKQGQYFLLTDI